jgi:hypothetical protein
MEHPRITDQRLLAVQSELAALEPIFHHPKLGTSREAYEAMTEDSFWEVGASGRRYSRDSIVQIALERYSQPYEDEWETRDFHCQELSENLYLLTYTLLQGSRVTRRSTIWRRVETHWKIAFHQGTVVEESCEPASARGEA